MEYIELNELQKNAIKELQKKVFDFLDKNSLRFDKNIVNTKIEINSNINTLDLSIISKLMSENLIEINKLTEQYSVLNIIVEYLKVLKDNFIVNFRKKIKSEKEKITNAEIERMMETNEYYFAIKYLVFLYRDVYLSRINYLLEIAKSYKELLSREITIRSIK
ncbi:MAG: hypothetical protein KatS3mg068_1521 [Candidatus Sericytochromatia bacterium]|nr:MAG: hypothetical protein KatS3mg068_1521 [Candidatus Sericytochromatia bacterium]